MRNMAQIIQKCTWPLFHIYMIYVPKLSCQFVNLVGAATESIGGGMSIVLILSIAFEINCLQ